MINVTSVFQGMTPPPFRPYLRGIFENIQNDYDRYIVPCCGAFTIPFAMVEAGIKPEQIVASDISIFSYLMGSYINGVDPQNLEIEIESEFYDEICKRTKNKGYGEIMLTMKVLQLEEHIYFQKMYQDEMIKNAPLYAKQFEDKLIPTKEKLGGITYLNEDLFVEIDKYKKDKKTCIWVNPPAYKGGYEKMFDFRDLVRFVVEPKFTEFDWKKDYERCYLDSKKNKALQLWYRYKWLEDSFRNDATFGVEYAIDRTDYILCNRPEEVLEATKDVVVKKGMKLSPYKNIKVWEGELKEDSEIAFIECSRENGLYYRNLWAHRIGNTDAEFFTLFLIDGQIAGTVGFHLSAIMRLAEDKVLEVFGFTVPHDTYDRLNRLLMMCLCSKDTQTFMLTKTHLKSNPMVNVNGLKTACLSKYRKVKLNNGILNLTSKKKLENGMYHLMYEKEFEDNTYNDCIRRFLEEWRTQTNKKQNK
jgi:hypothetical protein